MAYCEEHTYPPSRYLFAVTSACLLRLSLWGSQFPILRETAQRKHPFLCGMIGPHTHEHRGILNVGVGRNKHTKHGGKKISGEYPKTHVDERLSILDLGVESLLEASGVHLRQQVLHRIHLAHVAHAQQERRPRERRQRREGHQPPVNGTNVLGACSHTANRAPTFDGQAVPYGSAQMVRAAPLTIAAGTSPSRVPLRTPPGRDLSELHVDLCYWSLHGALPAATGRGGNLL